MSLSDVLSGGSPDAAVRSAVQAPVNMPTLAPPDIQFSPVQATRTISALAGSSPDTTPWTPGPTPADAQPRPPLWRSLLSGALAGLANSGHAKDFGSGLAAGAQGNE